MDKTKITFDEMKQPDGDKMKRQQFNNWNRLKEIVENGSPDKQLDESLVQAINNGIKTNMPNEKNQYPYLPKPSLLQSTEANRKDALRKYSGTEKVFQKQA